MPQYSFTYGDADFRIGYTDAEMITKEFGKTIPAISLADLERYNAVVKLLVAGMNQEPFLAKMLFAARKSYWPQEQAYQAIATAIFHAKSED